MPSPSLFRWTIQFSLFKKPFKTLLLKKKLLTKLLFTLFYLFVDWFCIVLVSLFEALCDTVCETCYTKKTFLLTHISK